MKTPIFFIAVSIFAAHVNAQDIITYKNGDEKAVKVIEVLPTEVKFKKFDNLEGPTYSEEKARIFMIKYENGSKDLFNNQTKPAVTVTTPTPVPDVHTVGQPVPAYLVRPNADLIVTIAGDSIRCVIDQVTSTVINYHIQRSGMDEKSYIPLTRVSKYDINGGKTTEVQPVTIKTEAGTPQNAATTASDDEDEFIPVARRYGGPRMGATFVGPGLFADALKAEGKNQIYSQFGWQFEKRLFTTKTGISSVVEFVPLIGGIDMGKFIPSASVLLGIRVKNGLEFGAGPNAAIYGYKDANGYYNTSTSFGLVIAAGMSFKSDKVYFPINLAFIPSVGKKVPAVGPDGKATQKQVQTGAKLSLLIGFNYRKR